MERSWVEYVACIREIRSAQKILSKLEGKVLRERQTLDGILKKSCDRTDSFCSGWGSVLGSCEFSHDLLSSIRGGEFGQLSDYQCIKKDCALWSHYCSQCYIFTLIILEVNTRLWYVC
jgi:hypothetical protein